jgi:hypothetical protein
MKSFVEATGRKEKGLVIMNSIFLPFHCEIISIWLGKEMSRLSVPELIVDFCDHGDIGVRKDIPAPIWCSGNGKTCRGK